MESNSTLDQYMEFKVAEGLERELQQARREVVDKQYREFGLQIVPERDLPGYTGPIASI